MYKGIFESFAFVNTNADTPVDAIVKRGSIVGITKTFTPKGEIGLAFIPQAPVYELTVTALSETATAGAGVYVDSNNAVTMTASGNTQIGYLWENAASGATQILVALK